MNHITKTFAPGFLLLVALLILPGVAAGEGKTGGNVLLRVFHTGNVSGHVSPCPT